MKTLQEKPTNELNQMLENTRPEGLGTFLRENSHYMADDKKGFYFYFKDILDAKKIKLKDVFSFAGLSESYGSQILRMEKHTTDRDVILRLCISGRFSLLETNRALKLYGMSELYAKEPRDACLIVAINNRIYDIYEIDDLLTEKGFKKIT